MDIAFSFMAISFYIFIGVICLSLAAVILTVTIAAIRAMFDGMV